jgi:PGF-pre-PGF domain-containing protein
MPSRKKCLALLFFASFIAGLAGSTALNTSTTWVVPNINYLSLSTVEIGCLNSAGNHDINITARLMPANSLDNDASITATITKPNNTTSNISLISAGAGVYTYSYNFDSNGTYKIDITAVDGSASGTASLYAYVGNFDLNISFLNNNPSYSAGNTGTIRNYVTNIEGNAMTGLSGNTIIYYPNSSVFATAAMSESGSGVYYYNFTVPSTAGTYSATSSFTCGTNTDSNSAGRFTVSAAPSGETPGGTGGTGGSGGSGGGGGAGGGGAAPLNIERVFFSAAAGVEKSLEFKKTEEHAISEIHMLVSETVKNEFVSAEHVSKPSKSPDFPKETKVFKYLQVSTSLKEKQIEKASIKFRVEKLWIALNEIEKTSIALQQYDNEGWRELPTVMLEEDEEAYYFQASARHFSYFAVTGLPKGIMQKDIARIESIDLQKPQIGVESTPIIKVLNNSSTELSFKVKVEIIQGIDVEYVSEEQAVIKAKQGKEIAFAEKWLPILAGTHVVTVKLYSPDKSVLYDTKVLRIDMEGELRYDVSIQCQQSVSRGNAVDLNIFILNAGDYYQDIDVSWGVADPEGKEITRSSTPLALRPKENRLMQQKIAIPETALIGSYTAKATVKYNGEEKTGTCSFNVRPVGAVFLSSEQLPLLLAGLLALIALIVIITQYLKAQVYGRTKMQKAESKERQKTGKEKMQKVQKFAAERKVRERERQDRFAEEKQRREERTGVLEGILGFKKLKEKGKRQGKGKGFSTLLGFKE